MIDNQNSEKSQFFDLASKNKNFDIVIHYLMEIAQLLKKKNLSEEEIELLKPYNEIINKYIAKEEE